MPLAIGFAPPGGTSSPVIPTSTFPTTPHRRRDDLRAIGNGLHKGIQKGLGPGGMQVEARGLVVVRHPLLAECVGNKLDMNLAKFLSPVIFIS